MEEFFLQRNYPGDETALYLLKAAQSPAMTTSPGMTAITPNITGDFVASLVDYSAAAQLFAEATQVSLDGVNSVNMPTRSGSIDPNQVPWISEGGAMPVAQFVLGSGAVLGPVKKMACLLVYTSELALRSNAEEVFSTLLRETAGLQLDATVFSALPATPARPAGILNGVTPLAAATVGDTAMLADLGALAGAVGTVTTGLAYVMHPIQANLIRINRGPLFDIPIWPTLGVPAGTVIALDPAVLATAYGAIPKIETANSPMLLMDDAPGPDPMAGPTRSLFQTDSISLRLLLDAAYAWRAAGAVAYVEGTTW
jgi:hypothetical protein